MNKALDDQIRSAIASLAEAPGEPAPFEDLDMAQASAVKPSRRPTGVALIAAVAAVFLIGLPVLLIGGGPSPSEVTVAGVDSSQPGVSTTVSTPETPVTTSPASTSLATLVPPSAIAGFDTSQVAWVRSVAYTGLFGSDDVQSLPLDIRSGPKSIAWDGQAGFVYVTNNDELRWVTADGDRLVLDLAGGEMFDEQPLLDVVTVDGSAADGSVFAVFGSNDGVPVWIDAANGAVVNEEELGTNHVFDTGAGLTITVDGVSIFIEDPDWSEVDRGEIGEPLWPFALPVLVVQDVDGSDLVRMEVGSELEPIGRIHDFDGQRLIFSVEPYEPALPSRTVHVLDLGCAECATVVVSDGPADWFDLIGTGS